MIYVTGDLHGDISRFSEKQFRKLKKHDTLIVCGDFGFVWSGDKKEQKLLKWIGKRKYQVLFIDGTHDNLQLLEKYPKSEWNGGMSREISGKLRYLCRGEIFSIEDNVIFAFGGGELENSDMYGADRQWECLPTDEEIAVAENNLNNNKNVVDYIITHQCSRGIKHFLDMDDNEANVLDTFLDRVRTSCRFKRWFFGSYHMNKVIPPSEIALYDRVLPITSRTL